MKILKNCNVIVEFFVWKEICYVRCYFFIVIFLVCDGSYCYFVFKYVGIFVKNVGC